MKPSDPPPPCLASLHDVMPETLPQVERVLAHLRARGVPPVTLLIVPGRAWSAAQLARLHDWSAAGHTLAAHGWTHHVERFGGIFHRLHARLLSRRVAEHLSLDAAGIAALMRRSHAWFEAQGLPPPRLYVPPAWALGFIPRRALAELPFSQVEVTRGLLDARTGRLCPLPLAGFEADTPARMTFLRWWNGRQVRLARRRGRPLRLSLHPHDLDLRLADQIDEILALGWTYVGYAEVGEPTPRAKV